MIKRESILLFSFLVAMYFFLPAGVAMDGGKNAVTSALKNLEPQNKPVYFVQIFDGDFPIPTRFEIQPNGYKESGSLRFQSPSMPLIQSTHLSGVGASNTALIETGTNSNFIRKFWKGSKEGDITRLKCYGLHVEIKVTPDMRMMTNEYGASTQLSAVLIHNNSRYVSIVGADKSLWKQLLSVYGALAHKKKGSDCKLSYGR